VNLGRRCEHTSPFPGDHDDSVDERAEQSDHREVDPARLSCGRSGIVLHAATERRSAVGRYRAGEIGLHEGAEGRRDLRYWRWLVGAPRVLDSSGLLYGVFI
jgi:hypothetical protein